MTTKATAKKTTKKTVKKLTRKESVLKRLAAEYNELAKKTQKLTQFLGTPSYDKLSKADQDLLVIQYGVMQQYLGILVMRGRNIKETPC